MNFCLSGFERSVFLGVMQPDVELAILDSIVPAPNTDGLKSVLHCRQIMRGHITVGANCPRCGIARGGFRLVTAKNSIIFRFALAPSSWQNVCLTIAMP